MTTATTGWYLTSADTPNASFCKDFGDKTAFAGNDGSWGIADRKPGYPNYREIGRGYRGATGAMEAAEAYFAPTTYTLTSLVTETGALGCNVEIEAANLDALVADTLASYGGKVRLAADGEKTIETFRAVWLDTDGSESEYTFGICRAPTVYTVDDLTIGKLPGWAHGVLGISYTHEEGDTCPDGDDWYAERVVLPAGFQLGEGHILDAVEFLSVEHLNGEPCYIYS